MLLQTLDFLVNKRDAGDSIGDGEYYPASRVASISRKIEGDSVRRVGEYRIDPEINRNPFKVYCDMTTDGGYFFIFTSVFINKLQTTAFIVSSSK